MDACFAHFTRGEHDEAQSIHSSASLLALVLALGLVAVGMRRQQQQERRQQEHGRQQQQQQRRQRRGHHPAVEEPEGRRQARDGPRADVDGFDPRKTGGTSARPSRSSVFDPRPSSIPRASPNPTSPRRSPTPRGLQGVDDQAAAEHPVPRRRALQRRRGREEHRRHAEGPSHGSAFNNIDSVTRSTTSDVKVTMKEPWLLSPRPHCGDRLHAAPSSSIDRWLSLSHGTARPHSSRSWVPGNHFTATKNPNYWRKGLAPLDEIDSRHARGPLPLPRSRATSTRCTPPTRTRSSTSARTRPSRS